MDLSYYLLSWTIYRDHRRNYPHIAKDIRRMRAFRKWMIILHMSLSLLGVLLIQWLPGLGLALTVLEAATYFINIPSTGEHIED